MEIRFRVLPDGVIAPAIACDECGRFIQGKSAGMVRFTEYEDPEFAFLHKGECDRAHHGGASGKWRELSTFLDQLKYNLENPFDKPPVHDDPRI